MLTSDLKGKYHHHVYFDNYFTSLEDLEKDKVYTCGIARKDRKSFPPQLKKPNLKNRCVYIYISMCMYERVYILYVHECVHVHACNLYPPVVHTNTHVHNMRTCVCVCLQYKGVYTYYK